MVDIRPIKKIAGTLDEPLKSLIWSEADIMDRAEYYWKSTEWLKFLALKGKK